ncbi:MAG: exosortase/archaeosortase family protein [Candidatus Aenigmarchaeota archaeon]|nr:exosortase/archaeosortase family protein [Candidatus Aenigmarchaeota archaeon]
MKPTNIQYLAIILLLGAFLYLFEIFYHGFVHSDFNKVQIILTFTTFILASGFLFAHEIIDKKIKKKDMKGFAAFFIISVLFLFLIFYTRTMNPKIPLIFASLYFLSALALNLKPIQKAISINLKSPMILFSLRFFIILGLIILPASAYEYHTAGALDFRFHSIASPMIELITPCVQQILSLSGHPTNAIPKEGGTTLILQDNSYSVFIGILCSGLTSLSVFIAAFLAFAWDMKTTTPRKAAMLIIGTAGTIFSNILRISTLFLVGLYYGNEAMTFMHTHLGWILYFFWITIFWFVAFRIAAPKTPQKNRKTPDQEQHPNHKSIRNP